jgi:DNA-binding NarL/FixJ family response regulator
MDTLTPRQRVIVALIAEGLTNREIAERLGLEPVVGNDEVIDILRPLSVARRLQIANWAVEHRVCPRSG